MKNYRCILIESRHVEVTIEAETPQEAADKAFRMANENDEQVGICPCDDPYFDKKIEVWEYNEKDEMEHVHDITTQVTDYDE